MRIAALYDVHGNLPAFEAALGRMRPLGFPTFEDVFAEALRGEITAQAATEQFESRRRGA